MDDDEGVRDAIQGLLTSEGWRSESFESPQSFLRSKLGDGPCCLVLDVRLPGANGLDFQRQLADAGIDIPIIFVTGHGDIPMSVRAMKAGAVEFLTKPFQNEELLAAVRQAVDRDRWPGKIEANWRTCKDALTRLRGASARFWRW